MKEGDIVCWQYIDNSNGKIHYSFRYHHWSVFEYFPTLSLLAFWRIKKLKQ
jgi:hypothetical protein